MNNKKSSGLPATGLVRINTVLEVLDISRATLYRGIKRGDFPAPVRVGKKCSRWRAEDIRRIVSGE